MYTFRNVPINCPFKYDGAKWIKTGELHAINALHVTNIFYPMDKVEFMFGKLFSFEEVPVKTMFFSGSKVYIKLNHFIAADTNSHVRHVFYPNEKVKIIS